jgi:hypothetical protein
MSRIFIYPNDSEQQLDPNAPFPQRILYRSYTTGAQVHREYQACGCFDQTDHPIRRHCQFHKGHEHCFWGPEQELKELFTLLSAAQQELGLRDDWKEVTVQSIYRDMRNVLDRLKK